jgi:hypothetical protein
MDELPKSTDWKHAFLIMDQRRVKLRAVDGCQDDFSLLPTLKKIFVLGWKCSTPMTAAFSFRLHGRKPRFVFQPPCFPLRRCAAFSRVICTYIYIYIHTHTHTHTNTYITAVVLLSADFSKTKPLCISFSFPFLFPRFLSPPFSPLSRCAAFSRVFKSKASFLFFILSFFLCCFQPSSPKQSLYFFFPFFFLQAGVLCNEKFQKQFPDFPEVTTNSGGTVEALFFFSSMWKDVEDLWDAV